MGGRSGRSAPVDGQEVARLGDAPQRVVAPVLGAQPGIEVVGDVLGHEDVAVVDRVTAAIGSLSSLPWRGRR